MSTIGTINPLPLRGEKRKGNKEKEKKMETCGKETVSPFLSEQEHPARADDQFLNQGNKEKKVLPPFKKKRRGRKIEGNPLLRRRKKKEAFVLQ